MKNLKYVFSLLLITSFNVFAYAAGDWEGDDGTPPSPGQHDGAMAHNLSLDMYIVLLATVAVMFIVYFVRQQYSRKVNL